MILEYINGMKCLDIISSAPTIGLMSRFAICRLVLVREGSGGRRAVNQDSLVFYTTATRHSGQGTSSGDTTGLVNETRVGGSEPLVEYCIESPTKANH